MNENLLSQARLFASRHQLEIGEPLGSGKDGIVIVAKRNEKPAEVAIKVHRFE
jgi:RIO-like serine/threonine protein kinase